VPERVVTLITAPPARPNSALKVLVCSLNSPSASGRAASVVTMPSRTSLLSAPIDHVIVGAIALPVHREAGVALRRVEQAHWIGPETRRAPASSGAVKLRPVWLFSGKLVDLFALDYLAEFGGVHFHQRRLRGRG